MAGSAERAAELAKKMMEQSALPFNNGYLPPSDPAFDFRSQIHALRDPVYRNRHDNSEKGEQLYQLFNDGNMEELDLTSQRLLNDYVDIYSTKRIMIMIKGIIVFFLL